jgi:hypothetical protein
MKLSTAETNAPAVVTLAFAPHAPRLVVIEKDRVRLSTEDSQGEWSIKLPGAVALRSRLTEPKRSTQSWHPRLEDQRRVYQYWDLSQGVLRRTLAFPLKPDQLRPASDSAWRRRASLRWFLYPC